MELFRLSTAKIIYYIVKPHKIPLDEFVRLFIISASDNLRITVTESS